MYLPGEQEGWDTCFFKKKTNLWAWHTFSSTFFPSDGDDDEDEEDEDKAGPPGEYEENDEEEDDGSDLGEGEGEEEEEEEEVGLSYLMKEEIQVND